MMAGMGFLSSFVVAPYDGVLFELTETFMSTLASWRPYSVDEQSMKLVIKIVSAAVRFWKMYVPMNVSLTCLPAHLPYPTYPTHAIVDTHRVRRSPYGGANSVLVRTTPLIGGCCHRSLAASQSKF